jgi:hypothetical protein
LSGHEVNAPVAYLGDAEDALIYCEKTFRTSDSRWVGEALSEREYLDFVRAGRPDVWPQP